MDKPYYEFMPEEMFDGTRCSICDAEDFLFTPTTFGIVDEKIYCIDCIENNNLIDQKKIIENEKHNEFIKLNKNEIKKMENNLFGQSKKESDYEPDPYENCRWGGLSGEEAYAGSWNCD